MRHGWSASGLNLISQCQNMQGRQQTDFADQFSKCSWLVQQAKSGLRPRWGKEDKYGQIRSCHLEVMWPLFSSLNSCFSALHSEAQRGKSKHGLRLTPLPASLPGCYSFLKAYKRSLSDSKHCSVACTEEPFTGESIPVIFLKEILKSSSPLYVYECMNSATMGVQVLCQSMNRTLFVV